METDKSQQDSTAHMAEAAVKAYGRIDGLVNNARLMIQLARRPWYQVPDDFVGAVMSCSRTPRHS